jgi:indole-3-glycerol phosphate synthase
VATYLDAILERHRAQAATDPRSVDDLLDRVADAAPTRGFREALADRSELALIAEIKRRSPSKGDLNVDLDPARWAGTYEQGGATCLSVLTDHESFGGSADDLRAARSACSLPVLRKDFTVSELDVLDARLMGADCLLLIAAALDRAELVGFHQLATEVGLDVLVEIHDEAELEAALAAGASLIGVNQRDLVSFEVDHGRAARMAGVIPAGAVKVAESGVRDGADARRLSEVGYDAILVGETLVTSGDPARAIADLIG